MWLGELTKNSVFLKRNAAKKVFSFEMVFQYAQEIFFLSGRIMILLMKQRCASMELLEFFEEIEQDISKKNTLSLVKRSLMFRGAVRSDGRKMFVRCPSKLNPAGHWEFRKITEEKCIFWTLFFNKIMHLYIN